MQTENLLSDLEKIQAISGQCGISRHLGNIGESSDYSKIGNNHDREDVSHDSGIVTEESDDKDKSETESPNHESETSEDKTRDGIAGDNSDSETDPIQLIPPPSDPKFYEWVETLEKLHRLNLLLENQEEQLLTLTFERDAYKTCLLYTSPSPRDS